ncbi:MAG TPA: hypothetical protein VGL13_07475 [Polyangiaceae bacterium]
MWLPLRLERLTLATRLSADECRNRLAHTTSHWLTLFSSRQPVRGFVGVRQFYFGPRTADRPLLRTWIFGRIREDAERTVIDVSIGPNRVAGFFFTVLAVMLGASAMIATVLAFTSPFQTWRSVALSWAVVGAFVAVFFVFPASDHPSERAYLLDHLKKTLEAQPLAT